MWLIIFGKVKRSVGFLLSATWKSHLIFKILVRHGGNPSSWKTEIGRLPRVQGQPGLTVILCLKDQNSVKSLETAT